jgi:hypothetical protein
VALYSDSSAPLVGIRQFNGGDFKPRIGIRGHHPRGRRRLGNLPRRLAGGADQVQGQGIPSSGPLPVIEFPSAFKIPIYVAPMDGMGIFTAEPFSVTSGARAWPP